MNINEYYDVQYNLYDDEEILNLLEVIDLKQYENTLVPKNITQCDADSDELDIEFNQSIHM